jgi:hypothetical protein
MSLRWQFPASGTSQRWLENDLPDFADRLGFGTIYPFDGLQDRIHFHLQ